MATFITRLDQSGGGLRLAVKDLIDMQGLPTTAGSRAVADQAGAPGFDSPPTALPPSVPSRPAAPTSDEELLRRLDSEFTGVVPPMYIG